MNPINTLRSPPVFFAVHFNILLPMPGFFRFCLPLAIVNQTLHTPLIYHVGDACPPAHVPWFDVSCLACNFFYCGLLSVSIDSAKVRILIVLAYNLGRKHNFALLQNNYFYNVFYTVNTQQYISTVVLYIGHITATCFGRKRSSSGQ